MALANHENHTIFYQLTVGLLSLIWYQELEIEKIPDSEEIHTALSHSPIAIHGNLLRIVTRSSNLALLQF